MQSNEQWHQPFRTSSWPLTLLTAFCNSKATKDCFDNSSGKINTHVRFSQFSHSHTHTRTNSLPLSLKHRLTYILNNHPHNFCLSIFLYMALANPKLMGEYIMVLAVRLNLDMLRRCEGKLLSYTVMRVL